MSANNTQQPDDIRIRLAEIMSSAGLGYNRISLEILYLLPREFIDRYQEVWDRALGAVVSAPGDSMARAGELGKAKTDTSKKGTHIGAGAGGSSKRWNRVFQVKDERALELKGRMDKRLRGMAREMRNELMGLDGSGASTSTRRNCSGCGRILQSHFNFCPYDGLPNDPDARQVS